MALLNANGFAVVEGQLALPAWGAWHADLVLENADPSEIEPGTSVEIATVDGAFSLKGTIRPGRSGIYLDSSRIRVVGGAGGLPAIATPKHYQQATARIILNDLLAVAGEKLSGDTDQGFLGMTLARWTTLAQPISTAIESLALAGADGLVWRVLPDGSIWLGLESWPEVSDYDYTIADRHPNEAWAILEVQQPLLLAGQSISELGKFSYVFHSLGENGVRTKVWLAQ